MTGLSSMPLAPAVGASIPGPRPSASQEALWEAARQLEATFLAEMLKAAGLGGERQSFGGGAGEAQFASFLLRAQAEEMVRAGGLGLAQSLFDALKETADGR